VAHPRTFRFGVQLSSAASATEWSDLARKAEDLGLTTRVVAGHMGEELEPVPALGAAADASSGVRVGTLVWDNDYKHPVVLAKEAATIDVLSGGRLEFGIGAGWLNTDYEQSGIAKDGAGVRIARMAEAVEIYRGLWADGPFSFEGEHYRITGLEGFPKPVQQPGPPVLIGGGAPKVLGIAGRLADIVGINPSIAKGYVDADAAVDTTPERVDQKVQWLREGAGDRFDDLELNILVFLTNIGDDAGAALDGTAQLFGVTPDQLRASPYAWVGSVGEVCEQLQTARDRWGTSYFVVQGADAMEAVAPIVTELAGT
jgi:probable F420-dependent oxidoreductase